MHRKIQTATALAVAGVFAIAAPAGAAKTQRVVVDRFADEYTGSVNCANHGPYTFFNEYSGRERVQVTEVLAADGTLLQTVFSLVLQETQSNSLSGATLPLKGAVHEVWDYASNTRTLDGKVWLGTQRGAGTYVHETGRIVMTLDTHVASFVAGPHAAFFAGGIDPAVCAALATA